MPYRSYRRSRCTTPDHGWASHEKTVLEEAGIVPLDKDKGAGMCPCYEIVTPGMYMRAIVYTMPYRSYRRSRCTTPDHGWASIPHRMTIFFFWKGGFNMAAVSLASLLCIVFIFGFPIWWAVHVSNRMNKLKQK